MSDSSSDSFSVVPAEQGGTETTVAEEPAAKSKAKAKAKSKAPTPDVRTYVVHKVVADNSTLGTGIYQGRYPGIWCKILVQGHQPLRYEGSSTIPSLAGSGVLLKRVYSNSLEEAFGIYKSHFPDCPEVPAHLWL